MSKPSALQPHTIFLSPFPSTWGWILTTEQTTNIRSNCKTCREQNILGCHCHATFYTRNSNNFSFTGGLSDFVCKYHVEKLLPTYLWVSQIWLSSCLFGRTRKEFNTLVLFHPRPRCWYRSKACVKYSKKCTSIIEWNVVFINHKTLDDRACSHLSGSYLITRSLLLIIFSLLCFGCFSISFRMSYFFCLHTDE